MKWQHSQSSLCRKNYCSATFHLFSCSFLHETIQVWTFRNRQWRSEDAGMKESRRLKWITGLGSPSSRPRCSAETTSWQRQTSRGSLREKENLTAPRFSGARANTHIFQPGQVERLLRVGVKRLSMRCGRRVGRGRREAEIRNRRHRHWLSQ